MSEATSLTTQTGRLEVRAVNGDGPTCGCGRRSALHTVSGRADIFLCVLCATAAAQAYIRANQQDDQGPPASGEYWYRLMVREHPHHHEPRRWCPECQEQAA